jgi:mannose-6-phosphate isomerase-like protein (cupin superfamily)
MPDTEDKRHVKTSWISKKGGIVEKPWGYEISWSAFSGIHGKNLFIKKGHKTSLKYHNLKSEALFLRSGSAKVLHGNELSISSPSTHPVKESLFSEGETLHVQSGSPYRIIAIEDCEIVEIGNHSDHSPVRLEDDYGRVNEQNEKNS